VQFAQGGLDEYSQNYLQIWSKQVEDIFHRGDCMDLDKQVKGNDSQSTFHFFKKGGVMFYILFHHHLLLTCFEKSVGVQHDKSIRFYY
jgi:hypothetical protein